VFFLRRAKFEFDEDLQEKRIKLVDQEAVARRAPPV
jgi:hypothetical protein